MVDDKDTIKIINAPPPGPVEAGNYLPSDGEDRQVPQAGWNPFSRKRVEDLAAELERTKEKVAHLVKSLAGTVAEGLELEEVSVGLAISIEGDIGIASAGAEASVELTFKVKRS